MEERGGPRAVRRSSGTEAASLGPAGLWAAVGGSHGQCLTLHRWRRRLRWTRHSTPSPLQFLIQRGLEDEPKEEAGEGGGGGGGGEDAGGEDEGGEGGVVQAHRWLPGLRRRAGPGDVVRQPLGLPSPRPHRLRGRGRGLVAAPDVLRSSFLPGGRTTGIALTPALPDRSLDVLRGCPVRGGPGCLSLLVPLLRAPRLWQSLSVSALLEEYMGNWFFWEMTPQWLRILWHVAPVQAVQERIVCSGLVLRCGADRHGPTSSWR